MKKAILSATVLFVCSIRCVGGEVSLFSLTNEWGKGSTLDFRKKSLPDCSCCFKERRG